MDNNTNTSTLSMSKAEIKDELTKSLTNLSALYLENGSVLLARLCTKTIEYVSHYNVREFVNDYDIRKALSDINTIINSLSDASILHNNIHIAAASTFGVIMEAINDMIEID